MKPDRIGPFLRLGAAVALLAARPALADDLTDLRLQLAQTEKALAELAATRAQVRLAPGAAVVPGAGQKTWTLPGTNISVRVYGYTKADAIYTLNGDGTNPDASSARANSRGRSGDGTLENRFLFTAQQSRFGIRTWTPTDWGELQTRIEGDFDGTGNFTWRLRHAYGSLGPVLAGQTTNLFSSGFADPELLDDGGSWGQTGVPRTTQLRYTHNFGQGTSLAVGLIAPGDLIRTTGAPVVTTGDRLPDFEFALSHTFAGGHVAFAGVVGQHEVDGTFNGRDTDIKWGILLAGVYKVNKVFLIGGSWYVGKGIAGRFIKSANANDAVVDVNAAGNYALRSLLSTGGVAWMQYRITDTIRTNVALSYVWTDVSGEYSGGKNNAALAGAPNLVNMAYSIHANLIWSPVPQVNFGIEYIHGFSAYTNQGNGFFDRIQVAMQYKF